MMKVKMSVERGPGAGEWLVHWGTDVDEQGQSISICMNVPFVHPSPRISDLERKALEQAVTIFQELLQGMPYAQDK